MTSRVLEEGPGPHVGYLVSRYPAVSHTFIRREVSALRKRGLRVDTFALRSPAPGDLRSEEDRAEAEQTTYVLPAGFTRVVTALAGSLSRNPWAFVRTAARALRGPGPRDLLWGVFYFAEAMLLARVLSERGVGHVHCHFANAGAEVARLACAYLGIEWSMTLHGLSDFHRSPGLRNKISEAAFVVCVSDHGRAQAMLASDPRDWERIHVSRCGLDLTAVAKARPGAPGAPLRILCVARFNPEKALPELIGAFSEAVGQGLDAVLTLVGDGPERPRVMSRIEQLGLGDRCRLTGPLGEKDVAQVYAENDLFVLSSLMEGLPVVLMEAMAAGLPVVAPRLSGVPELVIDGETGRLFTAGRWDQLASALHELGGNPGLRDALGSAAAAKVAAEYDLDHVVEPLHELLTADPVGRCRRPGRAGIPL